MLASTRLAACWHQRFSTQTPRKIRVCISIIIAVKLQKQITIQQQQQRRILDAQHKRATSGGELECVEVGGFSIVYGTTGASTVSSSVVELLLLEVFIKLRWHLVSLLKTL